MKDVATKAQEIPLLLDELKSHLRAAQPDEANVLLLEILAGYLEVASEDACRLAKIMSFSYVPQHEIAFFVDISERSFNDFIRALRHWKNRCLN